jgi:PAS domain S-box-containing protein
MTSQETTYQLSASADARPPATVLHVEDNEIHRFTRRRIFEQAGFRVLEATSVSEAWELVRRERPDVVVTDILLSDGNGYDLTARIKGDRATATIRVAQISAVFLEPEHRVKGLRSGADAYLIEPVIPEEIVATVEALARSRNVEATLRVSEDLLHTVIHSTSAVVYVVDVNDRLLLVNHQFGRLFGLDEKAPIGRSVYDCFPQEVAEQFVAHNRLVLEAHASREFEETVPQADGIHTYISIKTPLYDAGGMPLAVCGVSTDITEHKRLIEALEHAERQKDAFIATLAHELRQPISAMAAALAVMRTPAGPQQAERARAVMERQTGHLTRLVEDLLDASRIAQGRVTLVRTRTALRDVIESSVHVVQPLVRQQQQDLQVQFPDAPVWVDGDPARLQQVFSNLLMNATKFTPPGGRITIAVETADESVLVRVRDTGRGIAADMLPKIFGLFSQAVPEDGGGLGIGLAVVRGLVERHGGTVQALSSGPGQGSEFVVRLPVAVPA